MSTSAIWHTLSKATRLIKRRGSQRCDKESARAAQNVLMQSEKGKKAQTRLYSSADGYGKPLALNALLVYSSFCQQDHKQPGCVPVCCRVTFQTST